MIKYMQSPMAATSTEGIIATAESEKENLLPRRVCFSFAAYSKTVIDHLSACGVPIAQGLSEEEFTAVESAHGFRFPPDLRCILREGLPVGAGFPNWRSASPHHLQILLSLPASGLLYEISRPSSARFWPTAWGPRPDCPAYSFALARSLLSRAPKLVPVYRHFYIAAAPNLVGNPLFHVRGGDVRCCGLDLGDFLRREEFSFPAEAPAWAATEARRVKVWTDLSEGLKAWVKGLGWRLREAGWGEADVREMLLMEGSDGFHDLGDQTVAIDRPVDVMWHVRLLALALLRAGWSAEDVVYSMGGTAFSGSCHVDPTTLSEITFDF